MSLPRSPILCRRTGLPFNTLVLAVALAGPALAHAASFNIATGTTTTAQNLGTGQAGNVAAGATLAVGGSAVAVAVTGDNVTLNNQGTITQSGGGRAIRANGAVQQFVITNGSLTNGAALIRTADADVIQMNSPASSVTLENYGSLVSLNASAGGAQAVDFSAVTGANTINNHAGGLLLATEADAVRPGERGVVFNAGTIRSVTATGSSSDGIDGQENSGIRITNAATGLVDAARHGITFEQKNANTTSTLDLTNLAGGIVRGNDGSGINVDGFNGRQVVLVVNGGLISGNGVTGDGDGVDVDGLVNIMNTGVIRSLNAVEAGGLAFSEGISAGGGTIVNSGTIEGLVAAGNTQAVGRGITLAGNDIETGPLAGTREGLYGNAAIVNLGGGIIHGQGDSAIAVTGGTASGYKVSVDNHVGATIRGGGTTAAAIRTNADDATITNAGTIDGSSSGKAIAFGGGNDTLVINGGGAAVLGTIDGGAGTNRLVIEAGAGGSFAYAGAITNFASVELRSGALALQGADVVAAGSALVLAGGTLDLTAAASQTFASLALADSSAIVLGDTVLTFNGLGTIAVGETLALTQAGGSFTLRFLGDYAGNAAFSQLMDATTIGSQAVTYSFDGTYTNVSAVPEPATIGMLLGGLGIVALAARRRKAATV
ncbi:beta strand repeat-containing protein [Pseudoduganella lutea]|uniref:PEP-CTERM sorting domain-containing protein n=1 Tax=Pseudoduganella lutea TaxID=321985 RepID=A0A4P6L3J3_9BURK|nr:PEP-CTERM sorting domain-containing protein [Pseudoduganella lutea]QBE66059.1 PEP-CTERM sorting domain-containing protein [Pseudoduganella lutea]